MFPYLPLHFHPVLSVVHVLRLEDNVIELAGCIKGPFQLQHRLNLGIKLNLFLNSILLVGYSVIRVRSVADFLRAGQLGAK